MRLSVSRSYPGGNYSDFIIGLIFVANYIRILMESKRTAEVWKRQGMYWKSLRCVSPTGSVRQGQLF